MCDVCLLHMQLVRNIAYIKQYGVYMSGDC